jgi:hypothetical protein
MLNRTVILRQGDTHEHVTVNQQPHDAADAARLYGEIEEKAKAKIENLVAHNAFNTVKFVTYTQNKSFVDMNVQHYIAYTINGVPFTQIISYDDYEAARAGSYADILESIILPRMARAAILELTKAGRLKEVFPNV